MLVYHGSGITGRIGHREGTTRTSFLMLCSLVFFWGPQVMVLYVCVSSSRITVVAHVEILGMQSECRMW